MVLECTVRVIAAVTIAMFIGFVYHDPKINPLARMWVDIVKPKPHADFSRPLAGTAIAQTLLSLFIYSYVYNRKYSLLGLGRMASDLTFMSMLLQLPHFLWTMTDLRLLGISTLYNFLVVLAISLVVGYKHTDSRKIPKLD